MFLSLRTCNKHVFVAVRLLCSLSRTPATPLILTSFSAPGSSASRNRSPAPMPALQLELLYDVISDVERAVRPLLTHSTRRIRGVML